MKIRKNVSQKGTENDIDLDREVKALMKEKRSFERQKAITEFFNFE
jgi:hypothetical protein